MNNEELCDDCATLRAFQESLHGLRLDEGGLTRGNPLSHLERVAELSFRTVRITANAQTPEQMLYYRLAMLTQQLLTTLFNVEGTRIVRAYLLARAELLALQESTP